MVSKNIPQRNFPFWKKWQYAFKIGSWPKILVPFLVGQGLGAATAGTFSWVAFLSGSIFAVMGVIFIVLINDYGDSRIDRIKRSMFPDGCSPKTVPDGILPRRQLLIAAIIVAIIGFSAAFIGGYVLGREELLYYGILCSLVIGLYTLPPLKLNYRGGGELLEMAGIAFILPLFSAYMQAGTWAIDGRIQVLIPYAALAMASAVASGLSDEESDIVGGKQTIVTLLGNHHAKKIVGWLVLLGAAAFVAISLLLQDPLLPFWVILIAVALMLYHYTQMRQWMEAAQTNAFKQQKIYKAHLHRAIWHPLSLMALYLIGRSLFL